MRQGFIYLRVSDDKQETDGAGLDMQLHDCTAYCRKHEINPLRVYQDVYSGFKHYRERKDLSAMRDAIKRKEADVVVCWAVDRLARKAVHTMILIDEAEQYGVKYVFAKESFEDDPIGRMVLQIKATMAELDRDRIVDRTQGGLRARVARGMMLVGSKAPFGYAWIMETPDGATTPKKTRLVINDEEARIVRRIYDELLLGYSARQIALRLNSEGRPSPKGGRWTSSNIAMMVRNPVYKGEPRAYRLAGEPEGERARGGKSRSFSSQQTKEGISAGTAPVLVAAEEWSDACARLDKASEMSPRRTKNPEHFLLRGGYVFCGECGHTMHVKSTGTRLDKRYNVVRVAPSTYRCSNTFSNPDPTKNSCGVTITSEALDDAVWRLVVEKANQPEHILAQLDARKEEDHTAHDRAIVERQIAECERKMKNLRGAIAVIDDEDTRGQLFADISEQAKLKKSLDAELAALVEQHAQWESSQQQIATVERLMQVLHRVIGNGRDVPYEMKRYAMDGLGVRVRVHHANTTPRAWMEWRLPMGETASEEAIPLGDTFMTARGCASSRKYVTLRWPVEPRPVIHATAAD